MSALLDCSTCGGLIPAGRHCCPHCHCKSSAWKRWAIVATAAAGLGAASCDDTAYHPPDPTMDLSIPEPVVEYGPAIQFDMANADAQGE